jgi:manganese/iron transport system permease protein
MDPVGFVTGPMAYGFMQRGLVAAILVGVLCAIMGTFVVLKGLAFIGDAVSHATFPGLVIAYMLGLPLYLGGAVAAVAVSLAIGAVSRRGRLRFDTAVGVLFAGSFAFGIALFSTIKNYVADLLGYLLGNVLGISLGDLVQVAILGAIVLAVVLLLRKELLFSTFDPLGAAASGLPVAGLEYLLLALLGVTIVTPPATAQLIVVRFGRMIAIAAILASFSAVVGLYASFYLNLASGASIVLVETILFVVALLLGPRTGLLARASRRAAVAA